MGKTSKETTEIESRVFTPVPGGSTMEVATSNYRRVYISLSGPKKDRRDRIRRAANRVWPLNESWDASGAAIVAQGAGFLSSNETERAMGERLSRAIVKAHGAYCPLIVEVWSYDQGKRRTLYRVSEVFGKNVLSGGDA